MRKTEYVLYNASCSAALKGEINDAMVLLRQAIANGYPNLNHAKNDRDLQALHGRPDFEELFES